MDNTRKMLDRQIETCVQNLSVQEPGSQEELATRNQLEKLVEIRDTYSQKKDRWIGHGLTAAGIGVQLGLGIWSFLKGMKFEQTGSYTSTAFREWRQKHFGRIFK